MSDVIQQLSELLKEAGLKPVFGLEAQGHIPTIEQMLSENHGWDEIGKAIGWNGETAKQHYAWHLRKPSMTDSPTPRTDAARRICGGCGFLLPINMVCDTAGCGNDYRDHQGKFEELKVCTTPVSEQAYKEGRFHMLKASRDLETSLAAHREALKVAESALEGQQSFIRSALKCGCSIATDGGIDVCGPCRADSELDTALARIQPLIQEGKTQSKP